MNREEGDVPKVGYFRDIPVEFKIKSLYSNDLILNVASKSKETVQKLKFLDSPSLNDYAGLLKNSLMRLPCLNLTYLVSML